MLFYGGSLLWDTREWLVDDPGAPWDYLREDDGEEAYYNAGRDPFYGELYRSERGRQVLTPQGLFEWIAYRLGRLDLEKEMELRGGLEYQISVLLYRHGVFRLEVAPNYLDPQQLARVNKCLDHLKDINIAPIPCN